MKKACRKNKIVLIIPSPRAALQAYFGAYNCKWSSQVTISLLGASIPITAQSLHLQVLQTLETIKGFVKGRRPSRRIAWAVAEMQNLGGSRGGRRGPRSEPGLGRRLGIGKEAPAPGDPWVSPDPRDRLIFILPDLESGFYSIL